MLQVFRNLAYKLKFKISAWSVHWIPYSIKNVELKKNPIFKVSRFQEMILIPFDREKSGKSIGIKIIQFTPLCVEL